MTSEKMTSDEKVKNCIKVSIYNTKTYKLTCPKTHEYVLENFSNKSMAFIYCEKCKECYAISISEYSRKKFSDHIQLQFPILYIHSLIPYIFRPIRASRKVNYSTTYSIYTFLSLLSTMKNGDLCKNEVYDSIKYIYQDMGIKNTLDREGLSCEDITIEKLNMVENCSFPIFSYDISNSMEKVPNSVWDESFDLICENSKGCIVYFKDVTIEYEKLVTKNEK